MHNYVVTSEARWPGEGATCLCSPVSSSNGSVFLLLRSTSPLSPLVFCRFAPCVAAPPSVCISPTSCHCSRSRHIGTRSARCMQRARTRRPRRHAHELFRRAVESREIGGQTNLGNRLWHCWLHVACAVGGFVYDGCSKWRCTFVAN